VNSAIITCLDSFADASKGRYANFEVIGNPAFNQSNEPVAKWWREVIEPILAKHFKGTRAEAVVQHKAQVFGQLLGGSAHVLYFGEDGQTISDVQNASERSGQAPWAQKYGRLYTLQIVRWISDVFEKLTELRGYKVGGETLFGHHEFFDRFRLDDKYLIKQKRWS